MFIAAITIQILVAVAVFIQAKTQVPAINEFRENVAPGDHQVAEFHKRSAEVRALIYGSALAVSFTVFTLLNSGTVWFFMLMQGICTASISITVFNIAIAKLRNGDFPWWYLGSESTIDKAVPDGKLLAYISAAAVLICNLVIIIKSV